MRSFLMVVVVAFLLTPGTCIAQSRQSSLSEEEWARGYNGFALICRSLGLESTTDTPRNWLNPDARDSILVVLGGTNSVDDLVAETFARNGGAVLFASDQDINLFSLQIARPDNFVRASDEKNWFDGHDDCVIVSQLNDSHPVTSGLDRIVTNQAAGIVFRRSSSKSWQLDGQFPKLSDGKFRFLLATPSDDTQRVLVCSDPSIFSNQMLFHGDNARFALQAMNWLKQGDRTQLIIMSGGQEISPEDPRSLNVDIPPPNPEDVLKAIQGLPPDLLLEFGNEVATLVEDENLVNEFLSIVFEDVSDMHLVRGLVFLATFLLAGFLFYRYMSSESTLQDAVGTDTKQVERAGLDWFARRRKASQDRITVAREMVTRFYNMASGGHHDHYFGFPANLQFVDCENQAELEKGMQQTGKFLKWKTRRWWTQERLKGLRAQIDYWERLFANGQLVFSPDPKLPTSESTADSVASKFEST